MATSRSVSGVGAKPIHRRAFDPNLAAVAAKAVSPVIQPGYANDGERSLEGNATYGFKPSLDRRAQRNISNEQVMEILPDQAFSLNVLVSAILSPKDLTTCEINYKPPKGVFSSALSAGLIKVTKEYFDETCDVKAKLPEILTETLGPYGSYTLVVLPENTIDDFINGDRRVSLESFTDIQSEAVKPLGLLGNPVTKDKGKYSLESFNSMEPYDPKLKLIFNQEGEEFRVESLEYVSVTDNINALKVPRIKDIYRKTAISAALESADKYTQYDNRNGAANISQAAIDNLLYQRSAPKTEYIAKLKKQSQLKRKSIGEGTEIKIPSEAVITVFLPGSMKDLIGAFIAIDENGNPVSRPQETALGAQGTSSLSNSISAGIVNRIATNLGGSINKVDPTVKAHMDFIYRIAADMMEQDLTARLRNGTMATDATLAKNDDFYRIMMSRQLAKKYTQLLFIPQEYLTYFAFAYTPDGLGKSILDSGSQTNVMRATLLYADVIGSMKNSIGRTLLNVNVDETDPTPMRTAERMVQEMVESRQIRFPTTMGNPAEQMDLLQRSGIEVNIKSPNMPDTTVEFQNTQTSYNKPDQDISDKLQRQSIMRFGMTPELINSLEQPELATSVVSQNVIFAKNVLNFQIMFNPQLTNYLRMRARNSQVFKTILTELLENGKDQILLDKEDVESIYGINITDEQVQRLKVTIGLHMFLSGFSAELLKPVSVNLEQQAQEFDKFSEAAKKAIEAQINDSFFNADTAGNVSSKVETYKALALSQLQRDWMASHGYMPELSALTAVSDDNSDQVDLMRNTMVHVKALVRTCTALSVEIQPMIAASNKDLDNNQIDGDGASSPEPGSSGGGDEGSTTGEEGSGDGETPPADTEGETPTGEDGGTGKEDTPPDFL